MAYSNDLKLFANFMEEKDKFEWADVSTKDINIYSTQLENHYLNIIKKVCIYKVF